MMDVYVSVVARQNTTSNEREREGRKQSSHQHKSSSMQTSLKTHAKRERDNVVDKYKCCCDGEKKWMNDE
jgi:hypothetical protein